MNRWAEPVAGWDGEAYAAPQLFVRSYSKQRKADDYHDKKGSQGKKHK